MCRAERSLAVDMIDCEEHVVVGLVQNELGKLLGDTVGEHTTTIEFGIKLVGIEEKQDDGQFLIIELRRGFAYMSSNHDGAGFRVIGG